MAGEVYQFLDDLGTREFINVVMEVIGENFDNKVVDSIGSSAESDKMPSAASVLTLINELNNLIESLCNSVDDANNSVEELSIEAINTLSKLNIEMVTGNIEEEVSDPHDNILYFQHDNEEDSTWVIYIYKDKWISVGETKYDLLKYWKKDDIDTLRERFYELSIEMLTDDEIKSIVSSAYRKVTGR